MTPKTTKILYWVFTALFSILMILSAFNGVKPSEDAIKFVHDTLGYPIYFIPFISIGKIIGAIVVLIPNLNRIKEWAYAGLFFDLGAAIYSNIAVAGKFDPMMISMLIWIVPGVLSYYFWRKTIS